MTHVTCRLTAKNRDQLRNPTLGNRVWAPFLGSVQVVGFFDVAAARLCAGDGPITALVGVSSCSTGSALQHRTFNDYKNDITV